MPDSTEDILCLYSGRILEPEDGVLFNEARLCACVGALRAAYVFVWISCAESLKRRFKELSSQDSNAGKIMGEVGRREELRQAVDSYLLDQAKDYGILSPTAHEQLHHVYTMRCIYGHPYTKQPSREEVVAAAQIVVDGLLAQPTRLRHGFLQSQCKAMVTEPHFLDDLEGTVREYAAQVFDKTAADCQVWFVEHLWKALDPLWSDASRALYVRRVRWFLQTFMERMPESTLAGWSPEFLLKYRVSAAATCGFVALFPRLSPNSKDTIVGTLVELSGRSHAFLRALTALIDGDHLSNRQRQRAAEGIATLPLAARAAASIHPMYLIDDIIRELKSHNWYRQNPAVTIVQNVGPDGLVLLSPQDLRVLGNNVLQAADGGARDAISLLRDVADGKGAWPASFIEGVLAECLVNESRVVRYKPDLFGLALGCVARCEASTRARIIHDTAQEMAAGVPHPWRASQDLKDKTLQILHDVKAADPAIGADLSVLEQTIRAIPAPSF